MKLPPLIRWPGGQSAAAQKLAPRFPPHQVYVEPFVGGGSFFFHKEPVDVEVLGDTNPWLIPFYNDVREGALRGCRVNYSPEALRHAMNRHDACSRLKVSALAFGGFLGKTVFNWSYAKNGGKKLGAPIYTEKLRKLDAYEHRLRHATLTTGDFARTMRKYDSPETWHVLDPPWPDDANKNRSKQYYGKDDLTPTQVAKVCAEMEGRVWVLYNMHPDVIRAFQGRGFHLYRLPAPARRFRSRSESAPRPRLLITNYRLK